MTQSQQIIEDNLNAFCEDSDAYLKGVANGPLAGLTFAAKDIFDVAGPAKVSRWRSVVADLANRLILGR